jgi:hypothetical protein
VGQEVVADAEALHRREVAVHDAPGDGGGEPRRVVAALLDRVERLRLQGLPLRVGRVEVAHARVEVPAVIVEPAGDGVDVGRGLVLEVQEPHDHVRDLHARVVDVVLHAHVASPVLQDAHERVAERRIPEVADVGGLVRVDARVLDDDVAGYTGRGTAVPERAEELAGEGGAVEEEVHVAPARDLGPAHRGRARELSGQALRDLAGLAAQALGEVEGRGERDVPHLDARGVLEGHRVQWQVEGGLDGALDRLRQPCLPLQDHSPIIAGPHGLSGPGLW